MLNDARQPVKFFHDSFPFRPFPFSPVIFPTRAGPFAPTLITFASILLPRTRNPNPMDQRCTVCTHASLTAIDQALMDGLPLRPLAAEYSLSASALSRHLKHLDRALAARDQQARQHHLSQLLDQLDLLESRLDRVFRKAEALHSLHISLGCIQESVRILSLREKLRFSLRGRP
jgi:hypothetical protein